MEADDVAARWKHRRKADPSAPTASESFLGFFCCFIPANFHAPSLGRRMTLMLVYNLWDLITLRSVAELIFN
jgi:hypothetical protein